MEEISSIYIAATTAIKVTSMAVWVLVLSYGRLSS
jgi:hypothetical protein